MKRLAPLLLIILLLTSSCAAKAPLVRQDFALATVVRISLYDRGSEKLMDQLFEKLDEIEAHMSTSLESSDIYKLNRSQGQAIKVREDSYQVIKKARDFAQLTGGFFDPSLGRVVELWGIGTSGARVPERKLLDEAMAGVDWRKIELLEDNYVRIEEGTYLDLGAVAKGYAADELARIAREAGVKNAIFDLGGNLVVLGDRQGQGFRIGIQEPFSHVVRGNSFSILTLEDRTVVTSGNYERFFEEDGKFYHHIFDYRTGYPVENELASVTIITDLSIRADALSTAVYAMGIEEGLAFVEAQEDLEAIFVTKNKGVVLSSGIENFELVEESYHLE